MGNIRTLGDLRCAGHKSRSVKDEMRDNLLQKLARHEPLFPGIVGYDQTVVPALLDAILARHSFIMLGLRGQAKSRLLRALVTLLDPEIPAVAGCEIHDDPLRPICQRCRPWPCNRNPSLSPTHGPTLPVGGA